MKPIGPSIRVVLADRYLLHRTTVAHALASYAPISVTASTATPSETHQAVAHLKPDVVLAAANLPLGSGLELVRELSQACATTRVLVVAANPMEIAASVIECGGRGVVQWSQPLDELVTAIQAADCGEYVVPPASVSGMVDHFLAARRADAHARDLLLRLTPREREILALLVNGYDSHVIARRLVIAEGTVRSHIQHVLSKVGARTRVEAAAIAVRYGLVPASAQPPGGTTSSPVSAS